MGKISRWDSGLKAGNNNLRNIDFTTMDNFIYSRDLRRLQGRAPVETTLDSLFLGGQHSMSSAGENIFFKNFTSEVDYYPMWGGVKDQSIVANRGDSGLIAPSGRYYTTDYFEIAPGGAAASSGSIPARRDTVAVVNQALYSFSVIPTIDIPVGTEYRFTIEMFVSGVEEPRAEPLIAYEQNIILETATAAGQVLTYFFEHPLEFLQGTLLRQRVLYKLPTEANFSILPLRPIASNPQEPWTRFGTRMFEDRDLATESYVDQVVDNINSNPGDGEFAVSSVHDERYAQSLHLSNEEILTDDNDEAILFTSRWDGMDEGDTEFSTATGVWPNFDTLHLRSGEWLLDSDGEILEFTNNHDGYYFGRSEYAIVKLLNPEPETLHLRSDELLLEDSGIPILFEN